MLADDVAGEERPLLGGRPRTQALQQVGAIREEGCGGRDDAGPRQRDDDEAARGDAEKSGVVVRDAVSAMTAIETSSSQIGQIIGVEAGLMDTRRTAQNAAFDTTTQMILQATQLWHQSVNSDGPHAAEGGVPAFAQTDGEQPTPEA